VTTNSGAGLRARSGAAARDGRATAPPRASG